MAALINSRLALPYKYFTPPMYTSQLIPQRHNFQKKQTVAVLLLHSPVFNFGCIFSSKTRTMKQKMVIKVSMHSTKSRAKAMAVSGGFPGVLSVAIQGEDLGYIEVTGDEIDAVKLTTLLRKNLGHAKLVSVTPVITVAEQGGGDRSNREYRAPENNSYTAEPQPFWYPYNGGVFHNYTGEPQTTSIGYPYNGGVSQTYTTEPQPITCPYNVGVTHGFNDFDYGQDHSACSLM